MTEHLQVDLGERSYPLTFAADIVPAVQAAVQALEKAGRRAAVVTDRSVAAALAPEMGRMFGSLPRTEVAPGEGSKSVEVLGTVLDFLARERIDRMGVLFAFGGGIVGDLGGFTAASYLRGISYYQVPTTLLAMVDSSVGGKTGINLPSGKNLAGAFHQPKAVFIGTDLLKTLPKREFAAGMAEVIKYGLLGDPGLLDVLEKAPLVPGDSRLAGVIRRCCEIKAGFVQADERELAPSGGRALLNLGHTFGHAIEQVTGYRAYLHGEAVAIGLCAAARLSLKLGLIGPSEVSRVEAVVAAHLLPTRLEKSLSINDLLAAAGRDKKVRSGALRFIVMDSLGAASTREGVPLPLVEESFREIGAT